MNAAYSSVVDSLATANIDGRHVKKRLGDISAVDAYAARRVADDLEALIVEVGTKALAGIVEWPDSRGFLVFADPLSSGPEGNTRIYLQLTDERYRDIFRSFCGDVCNVLACAQGPTEAIRAFHQRLVRWQSFLQKHGPEGLSEEARCGLVGELHVLKHLLLPSIHAMTVVQAWRGCKKAHQDFQFRRCAIEVKTTRATIPDRVVISNVQQLDCDGMDQMYLTVVNVHENETTGQTLPEAVRALRGELEADALELLNSGLEGVGYSHLHEELYARTRYHFIDMQHFDVRLGFPRLLRAQIPDGIKGVRYEVAIDACRPYQVDEDTVAKRLEELTNDNVTH